MSKSPIAQVFERLKVTEDQITELRSRVFDGRYPVATQDEVNAFHAHAYESLCARISVLEAENRAWREAFSRGSLPPPRTVINGAA